jgi:hypothetical protein
VGLSLTDFIVIAVLVGVGCALTYVGLWVMLRTHISERVQETESQLGALTDAVRALEARLAERGPAAEKQMAAPVAEAETVKSAAKQEVHEENEEVVTPETQVMIAAAVTAFLGKKVRIRSAKMVRSPREVANSWSQQGRALVHASHNPRSRG